MEDISADENLTEVSVYLDYKWKLSVAQIVVILPSKYRSKGAFQVCKKGLEISDGSVKTEIHFKGLKLVPPSCHGMQWSGLGELQLRIQAYKSDNGEKNRRRERVLSGDYDDSDLPNGRSHTSSSSSENDGDTVDVLCPKVKVVSPVDKDVETTMLCCQCGEIIVKGQRFTRVLPLPADNWQDLTDSWFCCQHGNDSKTRQHRPLVPKPGDCLYSDSCLVLPQSALNTPGVSTSRGGTTMHCCRCRNILGQKTKPENGSSTDVCSAVLYRYQVIIHPTHLNILTVDKGMWLTMFEQGMSTMLLQHAEQNNCFRYVIESKSGASDSVPFMLIWLMDPNNVVYRGTAKIGQGHIEVMTPKSVAKVIYKDCLTNAGLAHEWRKDLAAQCISLPELQCTQLLQLLTNRTRLLPPTLRTANDFLISYLETSIPCPL